PSASVREARRLAPAALSGNLLLIAGKYIAERSERPHPDSPLVGGAHEIEGRAVGCGADAAEFGVGAGRQALPRQPGPQVEREDPPFVEVEESLPAREPDRALAAVGQALQPPGAEVVDRDPPAAE